jgi:hypothetical protein
MLNSWDCHMGSPSLTEAYLFVQKSFNGVYFIVHLFIIVHFVYLFFKGWWLYVYKPAVPFVSTMVCSIGVFQFE